MILNIHTGINEIAVFPGTTSIPCSAYRDYLQKIYLVQNDFVGGVFSWFADQKDAYNFFTHLIPGSGTYLIYALSAFDIEY